MRESVTKMITIEIRERGRKIEEIHVDPDECDIAQFSIRNPESGNAPDIEEALQASGRKDLTDRSLADPHTLAIVDRDGRVIEDALFEDYIKSGETAVIDFA